MQSKTEVRNPNVPGAVRRMNRAKYEAVRRILLEVLPDRTPGLTQAEMFSAVRPRLPADLFPGGATGAWWTKTVQLDLEAAGAVRRVGGTPLRWLRAR